MIASEPPPPGEHAELRPMDAWSLLTTPMSESDVHQVAAYIEQDMAGITSIFADPREFLVLAWDRRSAEMFREALGRLSDAGAPVPDHVLHDLDMWLYRANPYDRDYDAPWPHRD